MEQHEHFYVDLDDIHIHDDGTVHIDNDEHQHHFHLVDDNLDDYLNNLASDDNYLDDDYLNHYSEHDDHYIAADDRPSEDDRFDWSTVYDYDS